MPFTTSPTEKLHDSQGIHRILRAVLTQYQGIYRNIYSPRVNTALVPPNKLKNKTQKDQAFSKKFNISGTKHKNFHRNTISNKTNFTLSAMKI